MDCSSQNHLDTHIFDARGISKRFRHSAIFGAIESLEDGETMRFINDHDPLPLLAQIATRYGSQVVPEYVDRSGPVVIDFHIHALSEADMPRSGGCGGDGSGGCGC
ncbi:DUF2249 domain-containing protein [Uliginosibacterium sp. 31-16]|uniref:DUF2249 domain-containing protein n=1 Tax=Uliginosibacterium sp. 31-16 TaxID=3068315 RepID=UPI00273E80A2|nr:DUF2249 domain-containing protein [Uliginosibacterium sp. 31-16]MDP5239673.1 DUF2249 domain-containing protein [Uliginosibacterium sp. 31-16]